MLHGIDVKYYQQLRRCWYTIHGAGSRSTPLESLDILKERKEMHTFSIITVCYCIYTWCQHLFTSPYLNTNSVWQHGWSVQRPILNLSCKDSKTAPGAVPLIVNEYPTDGNPTSNYTPYTSSALVPIFKYSRAANDIFSSHSCRPAFRSWADNLHQIILKFIVKWTKYQIDLNHFVAQIKGGPNFVTV